MKRLGIALVMLLFASSFASGPADAADANPGTAFAVLQAPGVLPAAQFNNGGSLVAYYADTPGNGGNSTYRAGTDVDVFESGGDRYIRSSGAREYVKYTFEALTAGWYKIEYAARQESGSATQLLTMVDDRQLGLSGGVPLQPGFATVLGVEAVYLTAGEHVLNITFATGGTSIKEIAITGISAPPALSPRIVSSPLTLDEVVVADAVVTDPAYGADATGVSDATAAFQAALNDVARMGGGTVYAPPGRYKLLGTLAIPTNTTLRGDWSSPLTTAGNGTGTILQAFAGQGNPSAAPFINLAGPNAVVRNLSIWYPDQNAAAIAAYPPAIASIPAWGFTVKNVTLYNAYEGIRITGASASVIGNIYGTVLRQGIATFNGWEYSHLYNVHFGNRFWKDAPTGTITNAPVSAADRNALDTYTGSNLVGLWLGQKDGDELYNVRIEDAYQGILVKKGPDDAHAFYGALAKIDADITEVDTYPNLHFIVTDRIPQTAAMSYTFAGNRKPARTSSADFYNVMDYGAVADGLADDTAAIQDALDAAGDAGGGTVYLPQGQYKVATRLSVPASVELRGPYGGPHNAENRDAAVLLAYEGKGTTTADSAPAFITLAPASGIRGFSIVYPEQGFGTAEFPVVAYPYTVRSSGAGVWAIDMNILNAYKGVDLSTHRSDNYLLKGLWLTAFQTGVTVSNHTTGGMIERANTTFGNWYQNYRYNSPHHYGFTAVGNYTKNNLQAYVFGASSNQKGFGVNVFSSLIGLRFVEDWAGKPQGHTFWLPSSDTAGMAGVSMEGGFDSSALTMVGLQSGSSAGVGVRSTTGFAGDANLYGTLYWANGVNESFAGGNVQVYNESRNVALGKPAAASHTNGEGPERAVDGNAASKWVALTKDSALNAHWLKIDLGQNYTIKRWVVRHAESNGEPSGYNTRAYKLQYSHDGITFTDVPGTNAAVAGNTAASTDLLLGTPATARFWRLLITDATQPGYDGYARIYEVELYNQ